MNEVIKDWERNFYTELIVFIFLFITLYIALKKRNLFPQLKLLPIYLISFILLHLEKYLWSIFFQDRYEFNTYHRIDILSNYVVSLIELFVFLYYFHFIIQTKKLKFALGLIGLIIGMFFLLRLFLLLLFTNSLTVTPLHNFYVIESLVLLFCCICYFVELFKSPPVLKLTDTFNFWVSSGLLFYLFGTFPITLITNYFFSTSTLLYGNLFTIINIFYILMFLMIVRAYLCKQVKLV